MNPQSLRLAGVFLTLVVSMAFGQTPFDADTGRAVYRSVPDLPVDVKHIALDLTFDDMMIESFAGEATLRLRPVHEFVDAVELDAVDMTVIDVAAFVVPEDVEPEGARVPLPVQTSYDGRKLRLEFDTPLPAARDVELVIGYEVSSPVEGMIWAVPDDYYPDRPLVVHTQGETESSRHWFPAFDFPNDRTTTEVEVTVPAGFQALSNGALLGTTQTDSTATYHYRQDQAHVAYLVSLVIGQFDVVEETWRGRPVQYWVPRGRGDDAMLTFEPTTRILDLFSELTGVEYPYAKYAQSVVPLFDFGGMENTSATTLFDDVLLDERAALDHDAEGLLAHELAHQWFGDLITCRGWKHVWLNEGITSFMDLVWTEHSKGREEYLYEMLDTIGRVCDEDTTDEPGALVMLDYDYSFEAFFQKDGLPFAKGSVLMHMLRHQMGEELFWRALRQYVLDYRDRLVETDDFRRTFEDVTGRSLDRFFHQWAYRPGTPRVHVGYAWDAGTSTVRLEVTQKQKIDRATPAFRLDLDVFLGTGGEVTSETVRVDERQVVIERQLAAEPDLVCIDPQAGVLMKLTQDKPMTLWRRQLERGPSTIARIRAARQLSGEDDRESAKLLRWRLYDLAEHWTVRAECADALGEMQIDLARDGLVEALVDKAVSAESKVRVAIVQALGEYDEPDVGRVVAKLAIEDRSVAVEAAATRALGSISEYDSELILLENLEKDSYQNKIRIAALQALAEREDASARAEALRYAAYGQPVRTRDVAIGALGDLAEKNESLREELRNRIIVWLDDPQPRVRRAAIGALKTIGDEASITAIEDVLDRRDQERTHWTARTALRELESKASTDAADLVEEIRKLREKVEALQDAVEGMEQTP